MRTITLLAVSLPLLAGTPEEHRQIMRRSAELLRNDDKNLDRFLYLRRRQVRELDSDGKEKSRTSTTFRREPFDGLVITKVVAKNDQPLSAQELKEQDEKIRTNATAFKRKMEEAKGKSPQSDKRHESDEDMMIREMPEALDYKLVGTEIKRGRETLVFEFAPKPGYQPKNFKMKFFEKLKGKIWVDKATNEMAAADAEIFDTLSFGFGILGKMQKGTRFQLNRIEAAPGVWITDSFRARFGARIMLVKSMFQEVDMKVTELQLRPQKTLAASSEGR